MKTVFDKKTTRSLIPGDIVLVMIYSTTGGEYCIPSQHRTRRAHDVRHAEIVSITPTGYRGTVDVVVQVDNLFPAAPTPGLSPACSHTRSGSSR